jgi:hypothetical protein
MSWRILLGALTVYAGWTAYRAWKQRADFTADIRPWTDHLTYFATRPTETVRPAPGLDFSRVA